MRLQRISIATLFENLKQFFFYNNGSLWALGRLLMEIQGPKVIAIAEVNSGWVSICVKTMEIYGGGMLLYAREPDESIFETSIDIILCMYHRIREGSLNAFLKLLLTIGNGSQDWVAF